MMVVIQRNTELAKIQICIRIEKKLVKLVKKACKNKDENLSDFTRNGIRSELARLGFLDQDDG